IQPNLIANTIRIRPGFPTDWTRASLHHKDFDLAWKREALRDSYEFTSRLANSVPLTLILPAHTTTLPTVLCNGTRATCAFDPEAVGSPQLIIHLPAARDYKVSVEWHGLAPSKAPAQRTYRVGETLVLPQGVTLAHIDDPQHVLARNTCSPMAASRPPAFTPSSST
ncbi:MAG: alpha-L-rhamnosidase, partial [Acidobacteriaceae bacterium]